MIPTSSFHAPPVSPRDFARAQEFDLGLILAPFFLFWVACCAFWLFCGHSASFADRRLRKSQMQWNVESQKMRPRILPTDRPRMANGAFEAKGLATSSEGEHAGDARVARATKGKWGRGLARRTNAGLLRSRPDPVASVERPRRPHPDYAMFEPSKASEKT